MFVRVQTIKDPHDKKLLWTGPDDPHVIDAYVVIAAV